MSFLADTLLDRIVGTTEDVDKLSRRQVKVTKEHNDECKKLLTLMGIPWVEVRSASSLLFRPFPSYDERNIDALFFSFDTRYRLPRKLKLNVQNSVVVVS